VQDKQEELDGLTQPYQENRLANRPSGLSPISKASPRATPTSFVLTIGLIHIRCVPSRHS